MNTGLPRMAAVTILAGLLAIGISAQSAQATNDSGGPPLKHATQPRESVDPWSALEPQLPAPQNRLLQRRATANESAVLAKTGDQPRRPWARTLGALAAVVGLIIFLGWGYRAISGGSLPLLGKPRRPGMIEVISRTPLTARQSLCLVRIGPRLVLIGQSNENLRALDVIEDADLATKLVGEAAARKTGSSRDEFARCLEREARGYQDSTGQVDEAVVPDAGRIGAVQQSVASTLQRVRRAIAQV